LLSQWLEKLLSNATFVNEYGPTETTVGCATETVTKDNIDQWRDGGVPIGLPISNCQMYVLDSALQLVPIGGVGELYIGGEGLARGYLNRAELSAERFVTSPLPGGDNQRLYRSGDLVRWLPNSSSTRLDFLGRVDQQIKLRGFRIEPGEIEHQLAAHRQVGGCCVLLIDDQLVDGAGQPARLVAYISFNGNIQSPDRLDEAQLQQQLFDDLRRELPEYMIPSNIIVVAQMPLMVNGKIDKKALVRDHGVLPVEDHVAPQGEIETVLVNIWAQLLGLSASNISVCSNFFVLGGHSLLAVKMMADIRQQLALEVTVKSIFECPTIRLLGAVVSAAHKSDPGRKVAATARTGQPLPLSFGQQRLWFLDRMQQGGTSLYNVPMAMRIEGNIDLDLVQQVIRQIIQRHEILRTVYREGPDGPQQVIRDEVDFNLQQHDLSAQQPQQQQQQVNRHLEQSAAHVFDLSQDVMVLVSYLHLSTEHLIKQGILIYTLHHIVSDGWSTGIFIDEFNQLYTALSAGQASPLAPLEIQYGDYACWQNDYLTGQRLQKQLDHWQQQLDGIPAVHSLIVDQPRPAIKSLEGDAGARLIPEDLYQQLEQVANGHNITPFMLLHGAIALVLSRHSNTHDIVIGTPVANRMQAELQPLIGFFVNTLVLRVDTRCHTLGEYCQHIRTVNLDAQENQDVPFELVVEQTQMPRSTAITPLFQVLFAMDTNVASELNLPGLYLSPVSAGGGGYTSRFDLDITAQRDAEGLRISWVYDTSIFKQQRIQRLSDDLARLLAGIAAQPQAWMVDLPLLSIDEQHRLRELSCHLVGVADDFGLVHAVFEAQAQKTPNNVALVCADQQLDYAQLNQQANQLARHLQAQGASPGTLVGLCLPRSIGMAVGLLAILKTGAAYVPLDPQYPESRLQHMIKDSNISLLLVAPQLVDKMALDGVTVVVIDDLQLTQTLASYDHGPLTLNETQTPDSLAYVMYTSGSTGVPKGVMVSHRYLQVYCQAVCQQYEITAQDRVLQFSSLSFDIFVEEFFCALLSGARLVLRTEQMLGGGELFWQFIDQHQISMISLPTAYWALLGSQLETVKPSGHSLRLAIAGGEAMSGTALACWQQYFGQECFDQELQIFNIYGPAECTAGATAFNATDYTGAQSTVPIGKSLAGYEQYVLDTHQQLTPLGVVGELYIGGPAVARGYFGDEAKTEAAFISNPLPGYPDSRIYRTGDLVRYLDDGSLEFIGRADEQVKISGFRIEWAVVENQMLQLDQISSACVLAPTDHFGNRQLVAYVVLQEPLLKEALGDSVQINKYLRQALGSSLPEYMLPALYVVMSQLPMTTNGKIDKLQLPPPDVGSNESNYLAPDTDIERQLVDIWAHLLGTETAKVSAAANFFELGGRSLQVIRMVSEIKHRFDLVVPIHVVFEHQHLNTLADYLDEL
ncbi:MAG: amino acid adenylation domain-containing protein, partial [Psychrosphaera sp.]|nr:amino acid adenylation domain-containing protein [Psychrosphaera sp.]